MELAEHLFRREAGRMVATLTRLFGVHNLHVAEDAVADAFCRAVDVWKFRGVPEKPSAWLMVAAKNRAVDILRRERTAQTFAPELTRVLEDQHFFAAAELEHSDPQAIQDDELRMMFSCCHPELSTEAQVTLILKTLCGFGVDEIAQALLTSHDAIEKRLGRARRVLRLSGRLFVLDLADVAERIEAVHQAIYLLFNEGYHGNGCKGTVQPVLCFEALRLAGMLSRHPEGDRPTTWALLALMNFDAARLGGRTAEDGALLQLTTQDRAMWNRQLIAKGFEYLERSAAGTTLSVYHVEAAIAAQHCAAQSYEQTDWATIAALYETLYRLNPSPIVALNRAIAIAKASGPEAGLAALANLRDAQRLKDYPFYPAAHGEFHLLAGRLREAAPYFEQAMRLARNKAEASFFEAKLRQCRQ
jgi:RNA polymerase sigma factor (sigma-70 family)